MIVDGKGKGSLIFRFEWADLKEKTRFVNLAPLNRTTGGNFKFYDWNHYSDGAKAALGVEAKEKIPPLPKGLLKKVVSLEERMDKSIEGVDNLSYETDSLDGIPGNLIKISEALIAAGINIKALGEASENMQRTRQALDDHIFEKHRAEIKIKSREGKIQRIKDERNTFDDIDVK